MRRIVPGVVLTAACVVLSGCTAAAPAAPAADVTDASPASTATPTAGGPEVWGSASLWVSPEGEVSLCQVPFTDGGWGAPKVCDDGLPVEGAVSRRWPRPPHRASGAGRAMW